VDEQKTTSPPDLISHHTFLLPFKWSAKQTGGEQDGFVSVEAFNQEVSQLIDTGKWESERFNLDHIVDYNEFHYFYDYVREALYDYNGQDSSNDDPAFIRHLSSTKANGGKYLIETPIPKEQRPKAREHDRGQTDEKFRKTYELEIDSVLLHLYYTGVGVLSFHLHNRKTDPNPLFDQSAPEDVLYINQYGRRIFPAFYNIPHAEAGHQAVFENKAFTGTGKPHGGELAYSIAVKLPGNSQANKEDWSDPPREMLKEQHNGNFTFRLAAFIHPFLGELWENYRIQSVLDDRMFTVCWYGSQQMTANLRPATITGKKPRLDGSSYNYDFPATEQDHAEARNNFDWWYKFVFVDADQVTVQDPPMRRILLDEASYLRWSGYNTYFGITDYSFVMLTTPLEDLRQPRNNASYLVTHLQTIYFRLAELVLVQRACVQRFSDEVTHVSRLVDVPQISRQLAEPTKTDKTDNAARIALIDAFSIEVDRLSGTANELYKRYIRFINRVYFREVTAQVQGIELYQKLHARSRLPDMVDALSEEIHELHNYVRQETDRQSTLAEQKRQILDQERLQQEANDAANRLDEERKIREAEEKREKKREDLLTLLGALFVAPGILIAVYDLGVLQDCFKPSGAYYYGFTILAAGLAALLSYWAFNQKPEKENSKPITSPTSPLSVGAGPGERALSATRKNSILTPWRIRAIALTLYLALLSLPAVYQYNYCEKTEAKSTDVAPQPSTAPATPLPQTAPQPPTTPPVIPPAGDNTQQ